MEASIRRMALAELDPDGLRRLIGEGEPLFVERKEATPKEGLGPTIASFANTLGGWLLLGITDDGNLRGWREHGRSDLQDHLRHVLRREVDPLPPFSARSIELEGEPIGVVRVIESVDTPHIARRTGALYIREPGGKRPISDHSTLVELARRGEEALRRAQHRHEAMVLVDRALASPSHLPEDPPGAPEGSLPLPLEWIVRAAPLTVPTAFADRALSKAAVDKSVDATKRLWGGEGARPGRHRVDLDVFARGLCTEGRHLGLPTMVNVALDAGGIVAARSTQRRTGGTLYLPSLAEEELQRLLTVVADLLGELDAHGRSVVDLLARGTKNMQVQRTAGELASMEAETLHIGGELSIPAEEEDLTAVAERWAREFARAAGLPAWEP